MLRCIKEKSLGYLDQPPVPETCFQAPLSPQKNTPILAAKRLSSYRLRSELNGGG